MVASQRPVVGCMLRGAAACREREEGARSSVRLSHHSNRSASGDATNCVRLTLRVTHCLALLPSFEPDLLLETISHRITLTCFSNTPRSHERA